MKSGVTPIADTFFVASVRAEHRGEGLRTLERQVSPPVCLRMFVLEETSGDSKAGNRDHFQIGGVENNRPSSQVIPVGIIVFGVKTPSPNAIGMLHSPECPVTSGGPLLTDLSYDFRFCLLGKNVFQPLQRKRHGDRCLRCTLQSDGIFFGLEKIVPFLVLEDSGNGESCHLELFRIAIEKMDKRRAFKNDSGFQEISYMIIQAKFLFQELAIGIQVRFGEGFPEWRKSGMFDGSAKPWKIGFVEQKSLAFFSPLRREGVQTAQRQSCSGHCRGLKKFPARR